MNRLFLYIALFSTIGYGQQLVVKTNQGTTNIPTRSSVQAAMNSSSLNIEEDRQNEKVNIIVELAAPSLIQQRTAKIFRSTNFESQHGQLRQQIVREVPEAEVKKSFFVLFNAITLSVSRRDIEKVSEISGVKRVYEDLSVSSTPYDINALPMQSTSAVTTATGKDIKIGVIDTGIDYMHEALGKGYGMSFTVAGGYDFVNNDNDPMDDNGHGTHVAGIIAGNSVALKSVAHNSLLYAYKVLDAHGSGIASNVIAALERAISDSVKIINISLGSGSGDPHDILCEAVNRTVESGIVVVVAAGNAGEFESVNSPGIAEYALTVGASDGNAVAAFSSKGPVSLTYAIKPDVIAPGVGIMSAKPGGGYVSMSGTSMATPFVTAIAAALKELHTEWSPEQIKNAIISHATDLKLSLFAQGNGRADAANIVPLDVFCLPAHLSFGFDDPSQTEWEKTDTVMIVNTTATDKHYAFSYPSANPAVRIALTPSTFTVPSNGSALMTVSVTVNNLFLASNKKFSEGTVGTITGISNSDTITIPFTFFKGNILQIEYSGVPWQVLVHNRSTFAATFVPKGKVSTLVLSDGIYDIVTSFFGSYYVIKEGISVSGQTRVKIDKQEAVNTISILPVDENGVPFSTQTTGNYSYIEGIMHKSTGHAYVGLGGGMMNSFQSPVRHISNVSNLYTFAFAVNVQQGTARSYTFDVGLDSGIASSQDITFKGKELRKVEMKYSLTTPDEKVFPLAWSSFVGIRNYISVTFYDGNDAPLTFPYTQTTYYSNRTSSSPIYHFREAYRY